MNIIYALMLCSFINGAGPQNCGGHRHAGVLLR